MARLFDGVNDLLTILDNNEMEVILPCVLGMWFKTTQTGNVVIWDKDVNEHSLARTGGGDPNKYRYLLNSGSLRTVNTFHDGIWHQITFLVESVMANSKVFVDSVDDTSGTPTGGNPVYSTGDFFIGSRGGAAAFGGDLAEIFLVDSVLPASVAKALGRGVNSFPFSVTAFEFHCAIYGNDDPEPDLSGKGHSAAVTTGTTKSPHPPVQLLSRYMSGH